MTNEVTYCDGCLEPITNSWSNGLYVDGTRVFHLYDDCQDIFDEAVERAQQARKTKAVA